MMIFMKMMMIMMWEYEYEYLGWLGLDVFPALITMLSPEWVDGWLGWLYNIGYM